MNARSVAVTLSTWKAEIAAAEHDAWSDRAIEQRQHLRAHRVQLCTKLDAPTGSCLADRATDQRRRQRRLHARQRASAVETPFQFIEAKLTRGRVPAQP